MKKFNKKTANKTSTMPIFNSFPKRIRDNAFADVLLTSIVLIKKICAIVTHKTIEIFNNINTLFFLIFDCFSISYFFAHAQIPNQVRNDVPF